MSTIDHPPVRYPGAKWRLADWIMATFPPHLKYIEPYCGGASVLFQKPPAYIEVINDLDQEVVNFFEVLRNRADELVRAVELTPFARQEYLQSFEPAEDLLERARRFYVRSRQAFGGQGKQTGWRTQQNMNRGKRLIDEWNEVDHLWAAANRLKQVHIECDEALKVIRRYDDEKTLFYVDPPYVGTSRNRIFYNHAMTDDQHRELAALLHQVDGMVVLSGYPSELYDELYQGWTTLEKANQTNGNIYGGKGSAIEKLWISPRTVELGRLPLFAGGG